MLTAASFLGGAVITNYRFNLGYGLFKTNCTFIVVVGYVNKMNIWGIEA